MSDLPLALAPWAGQLSALTDELSVALGPWLTDISTLLAAHDETTASDGEPDGLAGLASRGTPERLLVSEWLLASEEPDEFLRRAAENELLHLATAFQRPAPRARVMVLCDCGPSQWGAARLAQLAVLLVLHRRAMTFGVPLAVGVLGNEPGRWHQGDLEPQLKGWHRSRQLSTADAETVGEWLQGLGPDDEVWLLGGQQGHDPAGGRRLAITPEWEDSGVSSVTLALGDRSCRLPMPPANESVGALRGYGFRSGKQAAVKRSVDGVLRFPMFPNGSRILLGRGTDDRTIVTMNVPGGRPRRHTFAAPVVAAGLHGKQLIALTADATRLRAHIVGKPMPFITEGRWLLARELQDLSLSAGPLAPLYFAVNGLFARVGDAWILLHPKHSEVVDTEVVAAGFGSKNGHPRLASLGPDTDIRLRAGEQVVFGAESQHCSSMDGRVWTTNHGVTLMIPESDHVVGMMLLKSQPALVSRSPGGQILRLATADGHRTLIRWSDGITAAATHPRLPWLAITRTDGKTQVIDLEADKVISVLQEPT